MNGNHIIKKQLQILFAIVVCGSCTQLYSVVLSYLNQILSTTICALAILYLECTAFGGAAIGEIEYMDGSPCPFGRDDERLAGG